MQGMREWMRDSAVLHRRRSYRLLGRSMWEVGKHALEAENSYEDHRSTLRTDGYLHQCPL